MPFECESAVLIFEAHESEYLLQWQIYILEPHTVLEVAASSSITRVGLSQAEELEVSLSQAEELEVGLSQAEELEVRLSQAEGLEIGPSQAEELEEILSRAAELEVGLSHCLPESSWRSSDVEEHLLLVPALS